jgi:hypothetical protein
MSSPFPALFNNRKLQSLLLLVLFEYMVHCCDVLVLIIEVHSRISLPLHSGGDSCHKAIIPVQPLEPAERPVLPPRFLWLHQWH